MIPPKIPFFSFQAPHLGNNGQLSRDERVQLYGIDCDDQVMFFFGNGWNGWNILIFHVKT